MLARGAGRLGSLTASWALAVGASVFSGLMLGLRSSRAGGRITRFWSAAKGPTLQPGKRSTVQLCKAASGRFRMPMAIEPQVSKRGANPMRRVAMRIPTGVLLGLVALTAGAAEHYGAPLTLKNPL